MCVIVKIKELLSSAKYGYSAGMLVLMDFKASDAGTYKCLVKYTDQFDNVNQAVKRTYNVASTGEIYKQQASVTNHWKFLIRVDIKPWKKNNKLKKRITRYH